MTADYPTPRHYIFSLFLILYSLPGLIIGCILSLTFPDTEMAISDAAANVRTLSIVIACTLLTGGLFLFFRSRQWTVELIVLAMLVTAFVGMLALLGPPGASRRGPPTVAQRLESRRMTVSWGIAGAVVGLVITGLIVRKIETPPAAPTSPTDDSPAT